MPEHAEKIVTQAGHTYVSSEQWDTLEAWIFSSEIVNLGRGQMLGKLQLIPRFSSSRQATVRMIFVASFGHS